jgi:hypothetical protein
MGRPPPPPRDLHKTGKALWRGVVRDFELAPSDLVLLKQAADVADRIETLREAAGADPVVRGYHGQAQVHPGWAELRSERRLLLALLGGLGLTVGSIEPTDGPVQVQERRSP